MDDLPFLQIEKDEVEIPPRAQPEAQQLVHTPAVHTAEPDTEELVATIASKLRLRGHELSSAADLPEFFRDGAVLCDLADMSPSEYYPKPRTAAERAANVNAAVGRLGAVFQFRPVDLFSPGDLAPGADPTRALQTIARLLEVAPIQPSPAPPRSTPVTPGVSRLLGPRPTIIGGTPRGISVMGMTRSLAPAPLRADPRLSGEVLVPVTAPVVVGVAVSIQTTPPMTTDSGTTTDRDAKMIPRATQATPAEVPTPVETVEAAVQTVQTYVVTFIIHYNTYFGQNILVAGSEPELGSWDLGAAFPLTWIGDGYWSAAVTLQRLGPADIEYKYVAVGPNHTRWEADPMGANREARVGGAEVFRDGWRA